MKNQNTLNARLEQFLKPSVDEFRLKFVFDHFRNYGIAAMIIYVGIYLIKTDAYVTYIPHSGVFYGVFLSIVGALLFAMNIVQIIYIFVERKRKMIPYLVASVVSVLAASELLWVLVRAKL